MLLNDNHVVSPSSKSQMSFVHATVRAVSHKPISRQTIDFVEGLPWRHRSCRSNDGFDYFSRILLTAIQLIRCLFCHSHNHLQMSTNQMTVSRTIYEFFILFSDRHYFSIRIFSFVIFPISHFFLLFSFHRMKFFVFETSLALLMTTGMLDGGRLRTMSLREDYEYLRLKCMDNGLRWIPFRVMQHWVVSVDAPSKNIKLQSNPFSSDRRELTSTKRKSNHRIPFSFSPFSLLHLTSH